MKRTARPGRTPAKKPTILQCAKCGNSERFLQVMEYEEYIVDGMVNYIDLGYNDIGEYRCTSCGAAAEPNWKNAKPSEGGAQKSVDQTRRVRKLAAIAASGK